MASASEALRRTPEQHRSRRRVSAVLDAAEALVTEHGLAPVTMTDIAGRAGMSLPALYRYFPDRAAVVRALALRAMAEDRELVLACSRQARNTSLEDAARGLVSAYRELESRPFRAAVRAAIAADPELGRLDLADTRANAEVLADAVMVTTGRTDRDTVLRDLLLVVHLAGEAVRLAELVGGDEGDALVDTFVTMITRQLGGDSRCCA
ncbi:MAG: TetR/AcrR family transcriptional regulator [Kineosporiaceae bacterium]